MQKAAAQLRPYRMLFGYHPKLAITKELHLINVDIWDDLSNFDLESQFEAFSIMYYCSWTGYTSRYKKDWPQDPELCLLNPQKHL